ncbi:MULTISPECIES: hypothetical protein [unclassified Methylococcus]|uniref:hypothetical protein n=1 Tax=unclassified Methylococcus TaxID=2618889 RepID=UPI003D7E7069
MSDKSRTLFVRLDKAESDKVRALSREFGLPMEEVIKRMILHALEQLEAEAKAPQDLPAGERQRLAFEAARREVEGWRPEF